MKKFLAAGFCLLTVNVPAFATGDPERGRIVSEPCVACHSIDGNSQNDLYPSIAGQNSRYLFLSLKAIQTGERSAPLMAGQLDGLSDQSLHDLAAYYEQQASAVGGVDPDNADQLALGERLYRGGSIGKGLPACIACHAPKGTGNAPAGFPHISGQLPAYTIKSLKAYREGKRGGGTEQGFIMQQVSASLIDAEIEALAQYIHGLH